MDIGSPLGGGAWPNDATHNVHRTAQPPAARGTRVGREPDEQASTHDCDVARRLRRRPRPERRQPTGSRRDAPPRLGVSAGRLARARMAFEGGEVNESTAVVEEKLRSIGATIMGRNMFGGGACDLGDDPWNGWCCDDPPFHHPVFVLTHHEREPLALPGRHVVHLRHRRYRGRARAGPCSRGRRRTSRSPGCRCRPPVPRSGARRRDGDQPRPHFSRRR